MPVSTSDSVKCSAQARTTSAATANTPPTQVRRRRLGCSPIQREVPIRSGSSAGAWASRRA
ncbi:hypothetical protein [Geodermatophilus sp. SYSU D01119]